MEEVACSLPTSSTNSIRRILVVILSIAHACGADLPGGLTANAKRASWTHLPGKSRVVGRCLWDRGRGLNPNQFSKGVFSGVFV
jgi:hypothetical protein